MKKFILLFVVCVVYSVSSYAQEQVDSRTVLFSDQMSVKSDDVSGSNSIPIEATNRKKEKLQKEQNNSAVFTSTPRVSKTHDNTLKVAPPTQRKQIIGNRPIIGNVPLQKYEEDLVPVKVK